MKGRFTELRESLSMALNALDAHKLRSSLTLLGVLVGVFSIILVMTAMRAMQNNVEKELGQMGSRTFVIEKMPQTMFGRPADFLKFLRREDITLSQAKRLKARV